MNTDQAANNCGPQLKVRKENTKNVMGDNRLELLEKEIQTIKLTLAQTINDSKDLQMELVKKDYERELLEKDSQIELAKKDHELTKKDYELTKKDHELTKKDYELELLKKEMEVLQQSQKLTIQTCYSKNTLHFIQKNYADAPTLAELMASKLTPTEKEYMQRYNDDILVGAEYLIKSRCLTNKPRSEWPIHGLDKARFSMAINNSCNDGKQWSKDDGASCIRALIPRLLEAYPTAKHELLLDTQKNNVIQLDIIMRKKRSKFIKRVIELTKTSLPDNCYVTKQDPPKPKK
jgi:hypothetical protein